MYVIRYEDDIVGPFQSRTSAQGWLDTLSNERGKYSEAVIEDLEDPTKTKAEWERWDAADKKEHQEAEARLIKASKRWR